MRDDEEPMTAADLLAMLEGLQRLNVALHKVIVRVEVSDDFYDKDITKDDVDVRWYTTREGHRQRYLIIHGD